MQCCTTGSGDLLCFTVHLTDKFICVNAFRNIPSLFPHSTKYKCVPPPAQNKHGPCGTHSYEPGGVTFKKDSHLFPITLTRPREPLAVRGSNGKVTFLGFAAASPCRDLQGRSRCPGGVETLQAYSQSVKSRHPQRRRTNNPEYCMSTE